jgi:hypothetical protein
MLIEQEGLWYKVLVAKYDVENGRVEWRVEGGMRLVG